MLSAHNLMQAAGDLGVPRVVYASSEMATGLLTEGTVPTQIPFDETEWHPSPNAYALSKYISEVIADSVAVRYPQTAWVGLRINNVIPPDGYDRFQDEWDDPSLSKANFWSYIDARDVGTAYRAALEGTSSGHEVCLIAAADTRAKRGLRELMAEYYDGYERFASDYEDPRSAFDCAKMKALFGWTPTTAGATTESAPLRRAPTLLGVAVASIALVRGHSPSVAVRVRTNVRRCRTVSEPRPVDSAPTRTNDPESESVGWRMTSDGRSQPMMM